MNLTITEFTRDRIPDVLDFENRMREEESFWGLDIEDGYPQTIAQSFDDSMFDTALSLLAYDGDKVVGRIDAAMIGSRFDGTKKAYLDWICVLKSWRHQGVAQRLLAHLKEILKNHKIDTLIAVADANEESLNFFSNIPDSMMRDIGVWISIK